MNHTFLYSKRDIASELARWAIKQYPGGWPTNLEAACSAVAERLAVGESNLGYYECDWPVFKQRLKEAIFDTPETVAWNVPASGRLGHVFVSRFHKPRPEDDFIDLDALHGNVCRSLRADWEKLQGYELEAPPAAIARCEQPAQSEPATCPAP